MSARAAWRLETLGFDEVYRYAGGKDDWWGTGLPVDGSLAGERSAAEAASRDVPRLRLDDPVATVAARLEAEGWPLAAVLGDGDVVLGRLRPRDVAASPGARARDLVVDGPRTIRGSRPAAEMAAWLDERSVPGVLITTADGELVGYLRREDVEP